MKHYQISKYANQESDTWSAVTDIGNTYQGEMLSQDEYLCVENQYIKYIEEFLAEYATTYKVKFLMDLRGGDGAEKFLFNLETYNIRVSGGDCLDTDSITTISRLCLRDLMGIRLEADCGSYITFGSDLYLRIGVRDEYEGCLDASPIDGLFVRNMDNDPDE